MAHHGCYTGDPFVRLREDTLMLRAAARVIRHLYPSVEPFHATAKGRIVTPKTKQDAIDSESSRTRRAVIAFLRAKQIIMLKAQTDQEVNVAEENILRHPSRFRAGQTG